jgi:uncharacterized coiled-coil protein SlyX
MTNLEKAQAWVDSRADEGREEFAIIVLGGWESEARNMEVDIDEYVDEKYGWVLRAIELKNSDDPFAIMTSNERAFAERMCDLEPRVYLEGDALKNLEDMMAASQAKVDARNEISRLELLKNPPVTRKVESFEDVFG